MARIPDVYTHDHHESALRSHTWATLDGAYSAAAAAFETWGETTPSQRQLALLKFADAVEGRAELIGPDDGHPDVDPDQLRRMAKRAIEEIEPDEKLVDAHEDEQLRTEEEAARAKETARRGYWTSSPPSEQLSFVGVN